MKISTKGRYALRLMLELAQNYGKCKNTNIKEIAATQEISPKYLEQLIHPLVKAGFVKSTRGSQGGYTLCQPPQYYTVGMILRLMEGDLAPAPCLGKEAAPCSRQSGCPSAVLFRKIQQAVDQVIDSTTLSDLLEEGPKEN